MLKYIYNIFSQCGSPTGKNYLLACSMLFITNISYAQVYSVETNIEGNFEIIIDIDGKGSVIINPYGDILDIYIDGEAYYYSDFNDYEADKVKRIGNVNFSYYTDFNNYEARKIKRIGSINFVYYSDFNNYEAGKIKMVGNTSFTYYSDFNNYEEGKIKTIGNTRFSYYSDFNNYETGKIKTIGNNAYSYISDNDVLFSNDRKNKIKGKLKSGNRSFESNGISYTILYHD